jgi:DNA-binding NarL/FixJ family response regulator
VAPFHLARGQTAAAAATLRRLGQWLEHACLLNPSVCLWRFDLGRALRHSAPDQAREIVTVGMRRADRFGGPLARARALRTLAALQPDPAAELLEEAVRILRPTPHRLERAHALAELGAALTRSDRDARALLSEALTLADECGALSLGDAIARRLGPVPRPQRRRLDALDARRQRVARLAADGHSESEIAYSMVLDLDTVTTLLREAHHALGAGSLAELRRALTP